MTGRQLAQRLEISQRTAHRYMEALGAAGVPVLAIRGPRGGWQLDEEWRTKVPGLDESELRALLMAQPRVIGDRRLADAAERALDKLMAAMPLSLRARATSIRQRLHVDTSGWYGTTQDLSALPAVQDAVWRDRKLTFRYKDSDRRVDPLGLVAKGTNWYLVAGTDKGIRTFRVSRIENPQVLDIESARPAGFDLAEHWKASTARFRESMSRYEATLRLEPKSAEGLKLWHVAKELHADPEGWVTLRVQFADAEQARYIVLGLGPRADVIEPPELRERVASDAAAVVARMRTETVK
jgi:predicted DNA-binding transcriptional regulator YafY